MDLRDRHKIIELLRKEQKRLGNKIEQHSNKMEIGGGGDKPYLAYTRNVISEWREQVGGKQEFKGAAHRLLRYLDENMKNTEDKNMKNRITFAKSRIMEHLD